METTMSATYASQAASHSSYPPALSETQAENSTAQSSAAQPYSQSQGIKSNTGSPAEYGVFPTSASSTSPSLPLQDGGSNHQQSQVKSDQEVPIDPSIAASSPSYQTHPGQYSPYPPQDISQPYNHPHTPIYGQPRPEWAGYSNHPHHPMQTGYTMAGAHSTPPLASASVRSGQVYSFVPIPGAQQHKRPRRRYEEIERMYKCGFNGCEKAYGTLNHLNAHVTMQSHGSKRTPEEFKEIRKEWKARKKEEENQRKIGEERKSDGAPPTGFPQNTRAVQLPPINYQTGAQINSQYPGTPQEFVSSQQPLTYSGYPTAPYGNGAQQTG